MNLVQTEWYTFILPLVTIPVILIWYYFLKSVVPKWFSLFQTKEENNET